MQTKRPFFIVGSGRSGTTLLQAMFLAAPGIYIPPETHFLPIAAQIRRSTGSLESGPGRARLIEAVLANCRVNEIDVDHQQLEAELRECGRDLGDVFDTLLQHIQRRQPGCRRIGEKSPVHLPHTRELLDMFPDGQVISIIRDGRDVAVSQGQSLGKSMLQASIGWRRDQRLHARYAATLPPERYTSVRYEDLVTDPAPALRRLCRFLDEPFDEAMLQPHDRPVEGFATWEAHKAMTRQPVTTARIGRYRNSLSPSQIALFQLLARRELLRNDYTLTPAPTLAGLWLGVRQLPDLLVTHFTSRRRGEIGADAGG